MGSFGGTERAGERRGERGTRGGGNKQTHFYGHLDFCVRGLNVVVVELGLYCVRCVDLACTVVSESGRETSYRSAS